MDIILFYCRMYFKENVQPNMDKECIQCVIFHNPSPPTLLIYRTQ